MYSPPAGQPTLFSNDHQWTAVHTCTCVRAIACVCARMSVLLCVSVMDLARDV